MVVKSWAAAGRLHNYSARSAGRITGQATATLLRNGDAAGKAVKGRVTAGQRGSQGLAAYACFDRPASVRDPPQANRGRPRHGDNAGIRPRGRPLFSELACARSERSGLLNGGLG